MENSRRVTSKFTCYFCNKTIENETEMGHMAMCGRVLISCPNKCGAYVPRVDLKKHNNECVNRIAKSTPKIPMVNQNYTADTKINQFNSLGRNGVKRTDNQDEIYKLSRKLAELESHFQFSKTQNQQSVSFQNFEALKTAQLQFSLDMEKIKYQNKITFDWRSQIDAMLTQLKQSISAVEHSRRDINVNLNGLKTRILLMEKLQDQISQLKDSFLREQAYNRQVDMNFNDNVDDFKKQFAQETAKHLAILADLKDSISTIKLDLENAKTTLQDQGIKFTNIIFDLQGASQTAFDASQRIHSLEKNIEEMKKNMNQMKLDMEILEGLSSSSDTKLEPGRLLWKITDVDAKMVQAKKTGNVLKSPIFFTHNYGYRVRILMYTNGLNKWQDRYALLCFHVLKGEYDLLLKWPCQIEGSVTLRDLEDLEKAKPFTKVITAKRQRGDEECEDPQESSSCYIFIPHNVLFKSNYVKDDTMFLDVKIRQNGKLETSL